METLREHTIVLRDSDLVLRPMTEDDWFLLYRWNDDPEVLYYAEGDDVRSRTPEEVHRIYRGVSRAAFMFIMEYNGVPIGECWLQRMNLPRILDRHPGLDLRRIDLAIGEKNMWEHGIGTRAIWLLTAFGFDREGADCIYGCDVADYNPRSRRAFERVGYEVEAEIACPPGGKARHVYDLVITRETYHRTREHRRS